MIGFQCCFFIVVVHVSVCLLHFFLSFILLCHPFHFICWFLLTCQKCYSVYWFTVFHVSFHYSVYWFVFQFYCILHYFVFDLCFVFILLHVSDVSFNYVLLRFISHGVSFLLACSLFVCVYFDCLHFHYCVSYSFYCISISDVSYSIHVTCVIFFFISYFVATWYPMWCLFVNWCLPAT